MEIYAIIQTGGKQYKVAVGQALDVESLPLDVGSRVELNKVLLVAEGDKVILGQPTIEGARVMATILDQGRSKKIIVFKYKPKVRYRKKTGHRQSYTRLAINEIILG